MLISLHRRKHMRIAVGSGDGTEADNAGGDRRNN